MIKDRLCRNCAFWKWHGKKDDEFGDCRRKAPSPAMHACIRYYGEKTECDRDAAPLAYWAVTADDEWCGEFEISALALKDLYPWE
jgi:hypothetical protein